MTTATAHLPFLNSQSLPFLAAHLNVAHLAQPTRPWSLSITSLRAVSLELHSDPQSTQTQARQTRRAWLANQSTLNNGSTSYLLIEDPQRPTRTEQEQVQAAERAGDDALALAGLGSVSPPPLTHPGSGVDEALSSTAAPSGDTSSPPLPREAKHARHTLLTLGTGALTLLLRLNLPPPLGAPSSGDGNAVVAATRGPGAWEMKGPAVKVEGPSWVVEDAGGTMGGDLQMQGQSRGKWHVRLGEIRLGKQETRGCLLQVEYLGTTPPLPPSTFLSSLFPEYLLRPSTAAAVQGSSTPSANPTSNTTTSTTNAASLIHANLAPHLWAEVRPGAALPAWDEGEAQQQQQQQGSGNGRKEREAKMRERGEAQALTCISLLRSRGVL